MLKRGISYWDRLALKEAGKAQESLPITRIVRPAELAQTTRPISDARILVRDFIHNSLYNPHYGYFSKQAVVFSPPQPFEFKSIKNNGQFMELLSGLYEDVEKKNENQQIWHTPTEIFQPFYGEAVARGLLERFKQSPSKELVVYEVGAGNGTLMKNILDFIKKNEPNVYKTTRYNIIEISPKLIKEQRKRVGDHPTKIINQSIFDWAEVRVEDCFFIAMEVLDNLSHDLVRYDAQTNVPYQGIVLADIDGDYSEAFEPLTDPLLQDYLKLRNETGYVTPVLESGLKRILSKLNPIPANLSEPEFVPTNAFRLLRKLHRFFPNHQLLLSDFHVLPDAVPGVNAPVVQTRYKKSMVPCSTYLVQPGIFDIFFPTNFQLLGSMYNKITGNSTEIMSHKEFVLKYADLERTTTKSGEIPIAQYYENVSFILSNKS